jgi:UDP:flavonoid glycosyltransferase YjiC (YdhE family)
VLDSLANGVPLVTVPITYEQPAIARRVEWIGAGRSILLRRLNPHVLVSVMRDVLGDSRYQTAARLVASGIQRAGGVARAADIIESTVRSSSRS